MTTHNLEKWRHPRQLYLPDPGSERRTVRVVLLTLFMMIIEIGAGSIFGSMALMADGWHMGTHAAALGITLVAYVYARRLAADRRFTFGTGKMGVLGGFTSAIVLLLVALLMVYESVERLLAPESIQFNEAILVAVVGLAVNLGSALLLGGGHDHSHSEGHSHSHDHDHAHEPGHTHSQAENSPSAHSHEDLNGNGRLGSPAGAHLPGHGHDHSHGDAHDHARGDVHSHSRVETAASAHSHEIGESHPLGGEHGPSVEGRRSAAGHGVGDAAASRVNGAPVDHNLKAAYLHVLADALTSVLAIGALLAGKFLGWVWMDALIGIVGALVISRWSLGLLRETGAILLDERAEDNLTEEIRHTLESDNDNEVVDLYAWKVSSSGYAAAVHILTHDPQPVEHYRRLLAPIKELVNLTVEVHVCDDCVAARQRIKAG